MADDQRQENTIAGAELPKLPASMTLLFEEYKIIQGKIDKLGEDKFKVRSWCFTVITGVLAGGKLSGAFENSWTTVLVLIFLGLVVLAFQLVELRQQQIAKRCGSRAQEIELVWLRQFRDRTPKSTGTPLLATFLIKGAKQDRKQFSIRQWFGRNFKRAPQAEAKITDTSSTADATENRKRPTEYREPARLWECMISRADKLFYLFQYFLLSLFFGILVIHIGCQKLWSNAPKPPQTALVVKLSSNEFHLGIDSTNIIVTNFVEVLMPSTNFVIVNRLTTNFVVTNMMATNFIR